VAALEQQLKQLEYLDTGGSNTTNPSSASAPGLVASIPVSDSSQKPSVQKSGLSLIRNARTKLGGLSIPQAVKPLLGAGSEPIVASHETSANIAHVITVDDSKRLEKRSGSGRLRRETFAEQSSSNSSVGAIAPSAAKLTKDDTAHRKGQNERLGHGVSVMTPLDSSKLANLKAGSSRALARAQQGSVEAIKTYKGKHSNERPVMDPSASPTKDEEGFGISPGNRSPSPPPPPPTGDPSNTEHEGDNTYSSDGFESPFEETEVPSTAMRKERDYGDFAEAKQSSQAPSHNFHVDNISSKRISYGSDSDSFDESTRSRRRRLPRDDAQGKAMMKFQQLPHSVGVRPHHRHQLRSDSSAVDSDSDASLDFDGIHGGVSQRHRSGDEPNSLSGLQKSPPLAAAFAREPMDGCAELRPVKGIPSNGLAYLAKIKVHASSRLKSNRSKELLADEKKSSAHGMDTKRTLEPMGSAASLVTGGIQQQLPGLDAPLLFPRGASLSPLVPGSSLSEESAGILSNPGLIGGRTSPTPRLDVGHSPTHPASLAPLAPPKILSDADQSSKSVALPLMLLKEKGRSSTMKQRRGYSRQVEDGSEGNTTLPSTSNSATSSPRDVDEGFARHPHDNAVGIAFGSPDTSTLVAEVYPPGAETKPSRGNPVQSHRSGGRSAKFASVPHDDHTAMGGVVESGHESIETSANETTSRAVVVPTEVSHTNSPGIAYLDSTAGGTVASSSQQQMVSSVFSDTPYSADIKSVKQKSSRKFHRASSDDFHRHIEASRMRHHDQQQHSHSVKPSPQLDGLEEHVAGDASGTSQQRPWSQTMNLR
jgi:hypothetical protein